MNITRALEAENGLAVVDNDGTAGVFITGGSASPVGLDLPQKSIYFQAITGGIVIWQKFGNAPSEWQLYTGDALSFDPLTTPLISTTVSDAIRESITISSASASPGFSLGDAGNTVNSWLKRVGGAPSNKTGLPVNLANAKIVGLNFGAEDPSTATLEIYEHEGDSINITLLASVVIPNVRTENFSLDISVTQGKQLAVFVNGNVKNPGVDLQLQGNVS